MLHRRQIDIDDRIAAQIAFELDDLDAASPSSTRATSPAKPPPTHTWSAVTSAYAALNRHELFATTQDRVNVDHHDRSLEAESGHLTAYAIAAWNVSRDMTGYIELCIG